MAHTDGSLHVTDAPPGTAGTTATLPLPQVPGYGTVAQPVGAQQVASKHWKQVIPSRHCLKSAHSPIGSPSPKQPVTTSQQAPRCVSTQSGQVPPGSQKPPGQTPGADGGKQPVRS